MQNQNQNPDQIIHVQAGEQITPLSTPFTHKDLKKLQDDMKRCQANNQHTNRMTLLQGAEIMIGDFLLVGNHWNNDDDTPHWSTWTDDVLFGTLLQMFPEDGQSINSFASDLNGTITALVRTLRLLHIEQFRFVDVQKYLQKMIDYTTKYGDVNTLDADQTRTIIKIAINNITKDRDPGPASKTANYMKSLLEADFSKMQTFEDYRIGFLTQWQYLKECCDTATLCGYTKGSSHSKESKQDHKRKFNGTDDNQAKKSKPPNTDMCNACGRLGHNFDNCNMREFHPNVNKESSVAFKDSKEGTLCFRKYGKYRLPFEKDLDGNTVEVPEKF